MDENKQDLDVSTEEQIADEEISSEVNVDELREKLADELGLDPDEQSDVLAKLVEREKANHKKLSEAIKQKINWRTKAQGSQKPQDKPAESKAQNGEELDYEAFFERKFAEKMEERDLTALNLSDDIKTEVKDLAKLKGISVREAAQHPYIKTLIAEAEAAARVEAATPKRSKKGSYVSGIDPSKELDPADFDFNTEEGRQAWKEAKEARAKYIAKNG